ncbi:MAG: biosynthetic arginine decarboxylase [Planctomycetaceae bacterium]|nr:MAG: biosynthetic arginine decarboxylase [Planctomycetaceae bacterium]
MSITEPSTTWTIDDAVEAYRLDRWGCGYFSISPHGNLLVHPGTGLEQSVDLSLLVNRLQQRGLELPILIRFNGILRDRLQQLRDCFQRAIDDHSYQGKYRCVFPIKVNQQRDVVQKIIQYGREFGFGLEAGSKPELLAVVAMTDPQMPIICNGFKDDEFIQMAMFAQQIGRTVIPVVEKFTELERIVRLAAQIGVRPQIGFRVKLAARGEGRWKSSGGYRSKFGLTVTEVLRALRYLEEREMADCFHLLHFHPGSQITNIGRLKSAINEAVRIYVDLHKRGAGLQLLDIGGGLGVDYDGSQSNAESSMNYTMQEYANDVVYQVQTVCDEAGVPHPGLITESGRAIAAHHSVLVFNALGSARQVVDDLPDTMPEEYEQPVWDLFNAYKDLANERNAIEAFHDAKASLELAMNLFSGGYLPLDQRALAESLFFAISEKVRDIAAKMEYVPEELSSLDRMLSDIYFGNFSLFQSMPDSWAIGQLFPIMPIHRLNEEPTRHAVLGDITCDSDGKIDCFIGNRSPMETIRLHAIGDRPYYLAAFLVGAYQEILGDLHNLFGDTHAVHVDLNGDQTTIASIVKGDTVSEVLRYVQFDDRELIEKLQEAVEQAVQIGRIDHEQAGNVIRFYENALGGYTYLSR